MQLDFTKEQWAELSQNKHQFNEQQLALGWQHIGEKPPTAEEFDAMVIFLEKKINEAHKIAKQAKDKEDNVLSLTDSVTSTSKTTAATPNSVRLAYDKAVAAYNRTFTKSTSVSSTSTATVATSSAVRLAYEKAVAAYNRTFTKSTSVSSTSTATVATSSAVKAAYEKAVAAYNRTFTKSTSVSSTSTATVATSSAVKAAYDKAVAAYNRTFTKSTSVSSTSTATVATSSAVKAAYDKAVQAYNKGRTVSVITGTVNNGATLPLPAGFSVAQCSFFISMNYQQTNANNSSGVRGHKCYLSSTRIVNCQLMHGYAWTNATANYLVIGVK